MAGAKTNQISFQKLKATCVPLLGNSLLTPSSIPVVSKLLSDLIATLQEVEASEHTIRPSLISYVFFPISSLLRRNPLSSIPDQVLEKALICLSILCEHWWWSLDETTWEQLFMLCGAILGGIDSKGKGKTRDDETKTAAARCLWALLRERSPDEDPEGSTAVPRIGRIFGKLQAHAHTMTFIPVLGQTLNSLLIAVESPHMPLQRLTLQVVHTLVEHYLPEGFVPSVLPGVVSTMSKIALGTGVAKGWANGDIVAASLMVTKAVIVRSIGDDICVREGVVRDMTSLEDLADLAESPNPSVPPTSTNSPYVTVRTHVWLQATASQLHIAINALASLVKHPTPAALLALVDFSEAILSETILTLPQSHPLLLSFLLSLATSTYESVSQKASAALRCLLTPPSSARHTLLQSLLQISRDNLSTLPRLISTYSDAKVEHVARLIESICRLAHPGKDSAGIVSIATGLGKLLGPNGGIEKWGWSLISVLVFQEAPISMVGAVPAQRMLESDPAFLGSITFPELSLRYISSRPTHTALEQMLRAMSLAAGDDGLFAIEWFLGVGQSGRTREAVAAMWCASRLLEGIGEVSLDSVNSRSVVVSRNRRVEKLARGIARRVAELWLDDADDNEKPAPNPPTTSAGEEVDAVVMAEHVKGLVNIRATTDSRHTSAPRPIPPQPLLHRALALQLLSITAGILEARFNPLLLHAIYPFLREIISDSVFVSNTALATLSYVAQCTSYATPANLLLSNFDYALDAVSHRLTRRWLDPDATKVLVILVRLVGYDVVQKAGDVVEECFDRLDEYHGYEIIVEGLVQVLTEVVKIVGESKDSLPQREKADADTPATKADHEKFDDFLQWFVRRKDSVPDASVTRDPSYPRQAWGSPSEGQEDNARREPDPNAEPPHSPSQALTKQIVSRSIYFLTHSSPMIRARILNLLSTAAAVLPQSALLPTIHQAWPFILNRFNDQEAFVVSAAASLAESLSTNVGDFMYRRIWDDVWPRFRIILEKLASADSVNALARRGAGSVGTESAYTHSHRLYKAILRTMTAAVRGVRAQDSVMWEVIVLFRRFLHCQAHEELQLCARELYSAMSKVNEDAVWLALMATTGQVGESVVFLTDHKWDISGNVVLLFP